MLCAMPAERVRPFLLVGRLARALLAAAAAAEHDRRDEEADEKGAAKRETSYEPRHEDGACVGESSNMDT